MRTGTGAATRHMLAVYLNGTAMADDTQLRDVWLNLYACNVLLVQFAGLK
jgi:hypothetical protein